MQHLKSTRDDWHRFHGDLPFYRAKTKMAENEMIVELSVLNPNSIEESPGKENIDPTSTTSSDQKKKLPEDGEKEKKKPRKWTEFEIDTLIEMLEERVCLWDVSCKAYHMRDKREKAYTEIKEALDISVVDIKTKITSLRAQLGREINKVRKKKSGQAATDNYESNWVFWEKLQFLIPVMQAGKSRDNLRRDLQTTLSHTSVIPEENNNQLGELDKDLSILPDLQNDVGPPGLCSKQAQKI